MYGYNKTYRPLNNVVNTSWNQIKKNLYGNQDSLSVTSSRAETYIVI